MDDATRLAALARAAADEVQPGMIVGLGTGSTADAVIRELGARVAAGLTMTGVPTSRRSEQLAAAVGIPLTNLNAVGRIDLGFDGADEIDPGLDAVKGRGGALLHEKLVALACDDYLLVVAAEKLVGRLGTRIPLPVEVIPFGWRHTAARLTDLGCRPTLRTECDAAPLAAAPVTSDGGHFLLDCATGPLADPATLAVALKATPGVVNHGLFLGFAKRVLIAEPNATVRRLQRSPSPPSFDGTPGK